MNNNIFHQTNKTIKLSKREENNSNIIKKMYSNYKYILWTDEDIEKFIRTKFNKYYNFFKNLSKIQKIDIVRYLWMYYYGGVYSDMDVLYIKRIDYEKYNGVVFIEREWTSPLDNSIKISVHNCIMSSIPKHTIWLIIIDEIIKKYNNGIRNVFNLTGPNSISEIITRLELNKKFNNITILSGKYIYQYNRSKHTGETSYVKHLCYGSWK
jgi:mannosyltransferase OCH1-like enzyme